MLLSSTHPLGPVLNIEVFVLHVKLLKLLKNYQPDSLLLIGDKLLICNVKFWMFHEKHLNVKTNISSSVHKSFD